MHGQPSNVAMILHKSGYEFGILGEEEGCCGNEIRRIGEAGLFEELMEENTAIFQEYGVKEIIALSPHCMNTLKKEYGNLGIKVFHYSEVVAAMIRDGAIRPAASYEKKVIYHDPCFSENRTSSLISREAYLGRLKALTHGR